MAPRQAARGRESGVSVGVACSGPLGGPSAVISAVRGRGAGTRSARAGALRSGSRTGDRLQFVLALSRKQAQPDGLGSCAFLSAVDAIPISRQLTEAGSESLGGRPP